MTSSSAPLPSHFLPDCVCLGYRQLHEFVICKLGLHLCCVTSRLPKNPQRFFPGAFICGLKPLLDERANGLVLDCRAHLEFAVPFV